MIYIISYDIRDPRRLRKVAKVMEDFGIRVQYSVFECELSPRLLDLVRERATAQMDLDEDSLRVYRLCADCEGHIERHGTIASLESPREMCLLL